MTTSEPTTSNTAANSAIGRSTSDRMQLLLDCFMVDGSTIAPVTDGAVALARATDAAIAVVPSTLPDLEDGLAAILRF